MTSYDRGVLRAHQEDMAALMLLNERHQRQIARERRRFRRLIWMAAAGWILVSILAAVLILHRCERGGGGATASAGFSSEGTKWGAGGRLPRPDY